MVVHAVSDAVRNDCSSVLRTFLYIESMKRKRNNFSYDQVRSLFRKLNRFQKVGKEIVHELETQYFDTYDPATIIQSVLGHLRKPVLGDYMKVALKLGLFEEMVADSLTLNAPFRENERADLMRLLSRQPVVIGHVTDRERSEHTGRVRFITRNVVVAPVLDGSGKIAGLSKAHREYDPTREYVSVQDWQKPKQLLSQIQKLRSSTIDPDFLNAKHVYLLLAFDSPSHLSSAGAKARKQYKANNRARVVPSLQFQVIKHLVKTAPHEVYSMPDPLKTNLAYQILEHATAMRINRQRESVMQWQAVEKLKNLQKQNHMNDSYVPRYKTTFMNQSNYNASMAALLAYRKAKTSRTRSQLFHTNQVATLASLLTKTDSEIAGHLERILEIVCDKLGPWLRKVVDQSALVTAFGEEFALEEPSLETLFVTATQMGYFTKPWDKSLEAWRIRKVQADHGVLFFTERSVAMLGPRVSRAVITALAPLSSKMQQDAVETMVEKLGGMWESLERLEMI